MKKIFLSLIIVAVLSLSACASFPLQDAVYKGDVAQVRELVEKGTNVNAKNDYGTTALMSASQRGHANIVKALLEKDADVNAKNNYGITALMSASLEGHTDIAKELLEKGADVNAAMNNGVTALMMASKKGHADVAKVLLDASANVNAKRDNGLTALMYAFQEGHEDIVEVLKGTVAGVGASVATAAEHQTPNTAITEGVVDNVGIIFGLGQYLEIDKSKFILDRNLAEKHPGNSLKGKRVKLLYDKNQKEKYNHRYYTVIEFCY